MPMGKGHYGKVMPEIEKATHTLLAPASRGVYLSPAMRLVATMMLLWGEDWERLSNGRRGMSEAEIADRTSLTESQVRATLQKLDDVQLVRSYADGWSLTLDRWREAVLKPWVAKAKLTP